MSVLETKNREWGFWGTMNERAAEAWPLAFRAIQEATGADADAVRAFLDSRYGRHFADGVNGNLWGFYIHTNVADAVAKITAEWMGWRITARTARETGIPAGLPYLTGFVVNEGIVAAAMEDSAEAFGKAEGAGQ
jgi:hypothetical protein